MVRTPSVGVRTPEERAMAWARAVPGFPDSRGGIFPTATVCSRRSLREGSAPEGPSPSSSRERECSVVIETPASNLSARVHALIAHHHAGDRSAAAEQLGIEPDTLAGLLTGDWRQFSLAALAVIVRAYDVSPAWLLAATGSDRSLAPRSELLRQARVSPPSP
jgi:hypothetical protein